MSKFFAKASELSESESESSSEDERPVQQAKEAVKKPVAPVKKTYMRNFEDSEESEEEQRVVKTQKDKRLESMNAILKDLNNHIKINDFGALQTDFDKVTEEITRSSHMIFEGQKDEILPTYLVRTFAKIEDAINEVTNEQKKKFNKTNSMSYNKLKQKLKKYLQGTGPTGNTYED